MPEPARGGVPGPAAGDEEFREFGHQLRRRGWNAQLVRYRVCGELDVRLHVARPGSRAVELLGAYGSLACRDHWQAVQITDDRRAVWCGPPRGCAQAGVIAFVEDLLQLDDDRLTLRYPRLG